MRSMIVVQGGKELQTKLRRLGLDVDRAVASALYRQGEEIMGESKASWVPVKTGVLKNTGHVQLPKQERKTWVVILGYGGPSAPYAVVQHERLDYYHPGQGRAKYLEMPAYLHAKKMPERVAVDILRVLVKHSKAGRR